MEEAKQTIITHSEIQPIGSGAAALRASRMTLQSSNTKDSNAVHFIEVARVKNDIAALKKLGPHPLDISNRAVLVDLKMAKSAKVSILANIFF